MASSCPAAFLAQAPLRARGRACAACACSPLNQGLFQAAQGCSACVAELHPWAPCVELAAPRNHIFSPSFLAWGVNPLPTPDQGPQGPLEWRPARRSHSVASGLHRDRSLRPLSASLLEAFDLHPGQSHLPPVPRGHSPMSQAVGSALERPLSSMMSSFFPTP